jgi:hypothetical protein
LTTRLLSFALPALATSALLACSPSTGGRTEASMALSAGASSPAAAQAATPAPAATAAAGQKAESDTYEVGLETRAGAVVGEKATAWVVVKARGPYHVNREYPMSFRPDSTASVAFEGDKVSLLEGAERAACADHPEEACTVKAPLRFTPHKVGEARVAGTVA